MPTLGARRNRMTAARAGSGLRPPAGIMSNLSARCGCKSDSKLGACSCRVGTQQHTCLFIIANGHTIQYNTMQTHTQARCISHHELLASDNTTRRRMLHDVSSPPASLPWPHGGRKVWALHSHPAAAVAEPRLVPMWGLWGLAVAACLTARSCQAVPHPLWGSHCLQEAWASDGSLHVCTQWRECVRCVWSTAYSWLYTHTRTRMHTWGG
jgi:hypothetical protein